MFNPAINPADPHHVFVACDMTGSYVTYDGGRKWRMFNLKGVSRFFVFNPVDSDLVYAGTASRLFRSRDRGNTWNTLYPAPPDIMAIHTQGDHASEVVVTKDSTITRIEKLSLDPDNPRDLFLLVERREKIQIHWCNRSRRRSSRKSRHALSANKRRAHKKTN